MTDYGGRIPDDKTRVLEALETFCILKGYRGSIAHGTYEETVTNDDHDIMGIFIPPPEVIFGIRSVECVERMIPEKLSERKTRVWDIVYYSIKKYLNLILKQNPNVIMLLWLSPKHYTKRTKWGDLMIENRSRLLSKQCYHAFVGYAHGQLHRMTHMGKGMDMGKKRKELVDQFGYDVKNASHLIRLLKMGAEALVFEELIVERPDNNQLLEIKRGEWTLDRVQKYADELFSNLDQAMIKSSLQKKVEEQFVNDLCMKIVSGFYEEKRNEFKQNDVGL
jgi:predicted nucleotidyltransferase